MVTTPECAIQQCAPLLQVEQQINVLVYRPIMAIDLTVYCIMQRSGHCRSIQNTQQYTSQTVGPGPDMLSVLQ